MKIAVYGSLRYGASANRLMKGCRRISLDKIPGKLFSLGAFPALKAPSADDPPSYVIVDVYEAPESILEEVLTRLDRYEGYIPHDASQSLYIRRKCLTDGGHSCWVYEYKYEVPKESEIRSGDWLHERQ